MLPEELRPTKLLQRREGRHITLRHISYCSRLVREHMNGWFLGIVETYPIPKVMSVWRQRACAQLQAVLKLKTVESTVTLEELLLSKRSCSGCLWFYTSCPSLFVLRPFEETPCDNLTPFLFRIVGFRSLQFKSQQTLDTQGLFIGDTWRFVHTFSTSVESKFYLVEGIESIFCISYLKLINKWKRESYVMQGMYLIQGRSHNFKSTYISF